MPSFLIVSLVLVIGALSGVGGFFWWRQRRQGLALRCYDNGVAALQAGEYPQAAAAFEAALKLRSRLIDARYGLGLTYLQQQQYQAGVDMLVAAVAEMPRNAVAHYNLGCAYIEVGKLADAQRVLETALRIDPELKEIHFNLARVSQEQGDFERAKLHCRNALKLDRNYARAKEYLALLSKTRTIEAINFEVIRQALQNFHPHDTEFLIKL